jgi:hypothetical protein
MVELLLRMIKNRQYSIKGKKMMKMKKMKGEMLVLLMVSISKLRSVVNAK